VYKDNLDVSIALFLAGLANIATLVVLVARDMFSGGESHTNATVAAFFDGVCVIELNPPEFHVYTAEGWLNELYKHGTWIRKDFV
jgi:hypothetical protein